MSDMILYISIIALGGVIGTRVRAYESKLGWRSKVQTLAIIALVVLMGARMGSNEQVIENIGTIGVTALVMTISIAIFSVLCLFVVRKLAGFNKEAMIVGKAATAKDDAPGIEAEALPCADTQAKEEKGGIDKMTIIIFISVIIGMAAGYFVARPIYGSNIGAFDSAASLGIKLGLCLLMVFVGLDLGIQGEVFKMLKSAGLKILLFPAATIIGTFIGAAVSGPLFGLSLRESLAVGAGFGWYSLAPGIIMEAGLIQASAVSFLHNVLREITSILVLPIVAAKVGYIEGACMAGAPSMDVCLPVINKETRGKAVTYGFITGVIMSFLVPVLVPLVLSIF